MNFLIFYYTIVLEYFNLILIIIIINERTLTMNIKKKVLVWLTSAFLICTTIFGSLLNSHITKANNSPTNKTSQELKKDNKEAGNNETNNKKSSQENKSRTKRET